MKNNLIPLMILSFIILVSCKNEPEGAYDPVTNTDTEYFPPEADIDPDNANVEENIDSVKKDNLPGSGENPEKSGSSEKNKSTDIGGTYIKVGEESDNNCSCYCLDINFGTGSEFCLLENEMYINTRFQRNPDNTVNVFLVRPSTKNKKSDIPFETFDTDTPIATIAQLPGGELKLDWLGFKSNGDLLPDYALFGKKTLEGIYKRK